MKIHTDVLTTTDLYSGLPEQVSLEVARVGSRCRDHGFIVGLEFYGEKVKGDGRYRRNNGRGQFDAPFAATYDEWGIWLARLYELDPDMKATYYENREDFYRKTKEVRSAGWRKDAKFPWLEGVN